MWPVTERYLQTRARSHTQLSRVEVLHDGVVVATLDGTQTVDPATGTLVQSVGGRVDVGRQRIRRSGTVDLLDISGTAVPNDVKDLFVPMITEVRPWHGVIYWDATAAETTARIDREWVPLATLVVVDVVGAYPRVTISGYDRMWYLSRFTAPHTVASGTNVATALTALLYKQIPSGHLALDIPSTDHTTGLVVFDEQADSADAAATIAATAGWALYPDPTGVIVARAEPSVEDTPVATYESGPDSITMRPAHTVSAADAVNVWVTSGDGADLTAPVRGYWEDTNPGSLTYVGRVGRRPNFHSSSLYRTTAQANLGARTLGTRNTGLADILTVPAIPNHALESGDVIQVRDPDQGIDQAVLADAFNLPMRARDGLQRITCRPGVLR